MDDRFNIIHEFYTSFFTAKTNLMKINQKVIEPTGINFSSFQLIAHISVATNEHGMTTAELAEDLLVSRQAVLKQMKCLLEEKLIITNENEKDKRSPYYCISEKGKAVFEQIIEEIYSDWMLASMNDFTTEEIKAATKILIHLTKFKYHAN